ncbi:hypothetical protein [Pseudomonas savastanoi]|uniref:hypothetical protein n=1 Tax=Pseudomonas savastanoi TaxID=29438 RepID=UPI00197E2DA5|nr:hypothetical protein [Pseudomonas savastanoi]MBN4180734.1 hypothetical protein [Pseudomonas savastanoi pv. phaseolicola]
MSGGQALYVFIGALIGLLFLPLVEFVKHRLQQYLAKKKLLLKCADIQTVLVGQLDMLASTMESRRVFILRGDHSVEFYSVPSFVFPEFIADYENAYSVLSQGQRRAILVLVALKKGVESLSKKWSSDQGEEVRVKGEQFGAEFDIGEAAEVIDRLRALEKNFYKKYLSTETAMFRTAVLMHYVIEELTQDNFSEKRPAYDIALDFFIKSAAPQSNIGPHSNS